MKLTFLGTRGNTEVTSATHRRHTSTLVTYRSQSVMIDCGDDWREAVWDVNSRAIVLTHAHPDHVWGLKAGAPCPVYATKTTLEAIESYPIEQVEEIAEREPSQIRGMTFEAFQVDHSIRAPAVGYRITAGQVTIFYVPDVVYIHDRAAALADAKLLVGDGATITRSMVREQDDTLIGHAPIRTQLTWCQKEGVPRAIFTHCGSEIIKLGLTGATEKVEPLARERDVAVDIAYDGMGLVLR